MKKNLLKNNVMEFEVDGLLDADLTSMIKGLKKYAPTKTILITMSMPISHFHKRVGEVCVGKGEYQMLLSKHMLNSGDADLYEFLGKMLLDTFITDTYYIKSHHDKQVYQINSEVE